MRAAGVAGSRGRGGRASVRRAKNTEPSKVLTCNKYGKRKEMGRVAIEESDFTVITSDNPRTENPQCILDDILAGVPSSVLRGKDCEVIVDRKEAIRFSVRKAQPGDLVLIAGKGHENYQILKTGSIQFNDREIAEEAVKEVSQID